MKSSRPVLTVRYETKAQLLRFKAAAGLRRWSLNTFVLAAAEALADQILKDHEGKSHEGPEN